LGGSGGGGLCVFWGVFTGSLVGWGVFVWGFCGGGGGLVGFGFGGIGGVSVVVFVLDFVSYQVNGFLGGNILVFVGGRRGGCVGGVEGKMMERAW